MAVLSVLSVLAFNQLQPVEQHDRILFTISDVPYAPILYMGLPGSTSQELPAWYSKITASIALEG